MISYLNKENSISRLEVEYWKNMVLSNLKIGVEIETNCSNNVCGGEIADEFSQDLTVTGDLKEGFGISGVLEVKDDGSLDNGIELVTVGRRLNFISMYSQYKYITDKMLLEPVYLNGRAGLHNHLLLAYIDDLNSMERNMPGIIYKNFMQLIRRYCRELTFLTSTMGIMFNDDEELDRNVITRFDYFCRVENLLCKTPENKTAEEYKWDLNGTRYNFVNQRHLQVDEDEIRVFHLELRFPDGSLFPAQIAAQQVLYGALLLKAIELSEFGLIKCQETEEKWLELKKEMTDLRNDYHDDDDIRLSRGISKEKINKFKELSKEMLIELKSCIDKIDKRVYAILQSLAKEPISLRLKKIANLYVDDYNALEDNEIVEIYKVINNQLHKEVQNAFNFKSALYDLLIEEIITNGTIKQKNKKSWIEAVARKYKLDEKNVSKELKIINNYRDITFDKSIGSFVIDK